MNTRQVPRNKFHLGIGASLSEACRCRANPTNEKRVPYVHTQTPKRLPRSHDNEFEQTRGIGGGYGFRFGSPFSPRESDSF